MMIKLEIIIKISRNYYQNLAQTITKYHTNCQLEYLINLSINSYIPFLSKSLKNVQRSPYYFEFLEQEIFPDEKEKIAELLTNKKAILVASAGISDRRNFFYKEGIEDTYKKIPKDYEVVLELPVPNATPFTDQKIYIAIPKNLHCQH